MRKSVFGEIVMSRLLVRLIVLVGCLVVLLLLSCDNVKTNEGLAILLVQSGEVILSDEHVAGYSLADHTIILTPKGVDRWKSFACYDHTQEPPIPKLGELSGKEFVMTVDGEEMYHGHFCSFAMSRIYPGVQIYDTLIMTDRLTVRFQRIDNEPKVDPRGRPEIVAYFRAHGKLR
jgi:hypothetical protein